MKNIENPNVPDCLLGHQGELEMRERFPSHYLWDDISIKGMIQQEIHPQLVHFLESQLFFFIATADEYGRCDASFRGTDKLFPAGDYLPVCKVINSKTLVFPDYKGNGLYNSLGNILRNPHIGMIFVSFLQQSRVRINGKASIKEIEDNIKAIWPNAQAYVQVDIEQVYGNCPARIPKMVIV